MYGLVNRAIQAFARDTRGADFWADVARRAGVPERGFEPMLPYDAGVTTALLSALANARDCSVPAVLEDLGTYLVADPRRAAVRRLMRFGGAGFADFLHSLADLPARLRLALPDVTLPDIAVVEDAAGVFRVTIGPGMEGLGHVALGLVRAMADDYGTLAMLEFEPSAQGGALLTVTLLDTAHAAGRDFALGLADAVA